MQLPIVLPPISSSETNVRRSSFTFLKREGELCERGEPIAYCCVFAKSKETLEELAPLSQDRNDLFAIVLAPTSGTVRWDPSVSRGGWIDFLPGLAPIEWNGEATVLGTIHRSTSDTRAPLNHDQCVIMVVGHRVLEWADARGGILPGWYTNIRSWPLSGRCMPLIIGTICVFRFAVLGENRDCRQFHAKAPSPLHVDYQGDTILIPTVGTLLEELLRTPDEKIAIERELRRWLGSLQGGEPWNSAALIGIIMERVMNESPLTHRPVILQHTGISTLEEAPTIVLSAESEDARIYKHKSLPLTLAFTNLFRLPADFKRVLDQECVLVPPRPVEEIALSYQHLAHILSARGSRLCVMNNFIHEPGAALLRPAWSTNIKDTYSFRTRSINEALGDLEDKGLLTVLDLDLVKATLGGRRFPDGSHSDRAFDLAAQDLILKAVSAAAT